MTTSLATIEPLDFQQLGETFHHHWTIPPAVSPDEEFLQLLEWRSDPGGWGPSEFMWLAIHSHPTAGSSALWIAGDDEEAALKLKERCMDMPPAEWDLFLATGDHNSHLTLIIPVAYSLGDLARIRRL